jgi:hypothetical protein
MPYKRVIKLFEERKDKLSDLLDADLHKDSKLRIEGAIDEIDFLLTTLKQEFGVELGHSVIGNGDITPLAAHELAEEAKALTAAKHETRD